MGPPELVFVAILLLLELVLVLKALTEGEPPEPWPIRIGEVETEMMRAIRDLSGSSPERIAERVGIDLESVQRILKRLEELDYVRRSEGIYLLTLRGLRALMTELTQRQVYNEGKASD